jgi:hypothetical protein
MIKDDCRFYAAMPKSDRHFCKGRCEVIQGCEGCTRYRETKWGYKEGITRFGKTFRIKVRIDDDL